MTSLADFARSHKIANDPIVGKIAWYARKNYDADDTEFRLSYITLCSHGIKVEGEPAKSFDDKEAAWASYWVQLDGFVAGREGVLHWRMLPRLVDDAVEGVCYVMSRVAFEPCELEIPQ